LASVRSRLRLVSPAVIPLALALRGLAIVVLALVAPAKVSQAAGPAASSSLRPADPLNQAAVEHYYNLDHDAAVQDFEKIAARHPNDAFALNHLLSAILILVNTIFGFVVPASFLILNSVDVVGAGILLVLGVVLIGVATALWHQETWALWTTVVVLFFGLAYLFFTAYFTVLFLVLLVLFIYLIAVRHHFY
jgi:hypothetical protein